MRRVMPSGAVFSRGVLMAILAIGMLCVVVVPQRQIAHAAATISSVYMTTDSDCQNGDATPLTSLPSGILAVCIIVEGTFDGSDVTAIIYDSSGNDVYQMTEGTNTGTGYVPFGEVQYRTGAWPDDTYRTDIKVNGAVVQSTTWTVGAGKVPAATSTPTAVPPSNSPIPPSATPQPPTTTPAPTHTAVPTRSTNPPGTPPPTAPPAPTTNTCVGTVPNVVRCTKGSVLLVAGQLKGDNYSIGTGFVVRSDVTGTYLVTNLHVVYGTIKDSVVVGDPYNGHMYKAQVVATNNARRGSAGDLAVIRIQPLHIPALHWGDSDSLEEGDTVISIGYPVRDTFSLADTPTITDGIVSALHRDEQDGYGRVWIQHQSVINHGNSGGPLLDLQGDVVGVNTLGISELPSSTGKGMEPVQGIFYAIPSNLARVVANKLITSIIGGKVAAPVPPPPAQPQDRVYKASGYQIILPGDWSVKDGTPVYLSPDGAVEVNATVVGVKGAVPDSGARKVIQSIAADFGNALKGKAAVSYHQASIGPLSGVSGLVTVSSSKEVLTVFAVGDNQRELLAEIDALPDTTPQDADQAGAAVHSIQLTS